MIIIVNGEIHTMEDDVFECGYVICDEGKIIEVGHYDGTKKKHFESNSLYLNSEIINVNGAVVFPGFIDAHCHIGIWEDGMGFEGADGNEEVDPITPHLRAIDAINPNDKCFEEAIAAGITTVVTGPGSANVIGGQFAAIKTHGRCVDEMIVDANVAMKVALGENPKTVYNDKKQSPVTRMATAALLRENLIRAKQYADDLRNYEMDSDNFDKPEFDFKFEALKDVFEKKVPLKIHAHRADDIMTAARICKEFDLEYTIEHCTEGYLIGDLLAENGVQAIVGPVLTDRSKIELKNQNPKNAFELDKKGIKIAIMTDHPCVPVQYLPLSAAICVKEGLNKETALKAITINAAEICKIDDKVGSIKVGKHADLVVLDGDPLNILSNVLYTIINGKIAYKKDM